MGLQCKLPVPFTKVINEVQYLRSLCPLPPSHPPHQNRRETEVTTTLSLFFRTTPDALVPPWHKAKNSIMMQNRLLNLQNFRSRHSQLLITVEYLAQLLPAHPATWLSISVPLSVKASLLPHLQVEQYLCHKHMKLLCSLNSYLLCKCSGS